MKVKLVLVSTAVGLSIAVASGIILAILLLTESGMKEASDQFGFPEQGIPTTMRVWKLIFGVLVVLTLVGSIWWKKRSQLSISPVLLGVSIAAGVVSAPFIFRIVIGLT